MSQQFDDLGDAYDASLRLPFRQGMEVPSLLGALGDLRGRSVLDAGCGSGAYTRLFRRAGARRVVGVDVAPGMISTAQEAERVRPLGVRYVCGDLADLRGLGQFDLAVGVYVLPYAATRDRLRAMCCGIAAALTAHGRFVTLPLNPDFGPEPERYRRYGFTLAGTDRTEGAPVTLTAGEGAERFSVTAHRWSRGAQEAALREAGFTALSWSQLTPEAGSLAAYGTAFWGPYLAQPHALLLECRKSASGTATDHPHGDTAKGEPR